MEGRKAMKREIALLWIGVSLSTLFHINIFASEKDNSNLAIAPQTQQNSLILPPVRRVGIDIVETNVNEFRNFMRKQDRLLHGVVALPYNDQDINRTLSKDLEKLTQKTGRFWDLSFSQFLDIIPAQNKTYTESKKMDKLFSFKHKLEFDYHLDAWLKPSVIFSPDETLVRLTLSGVGSTKSNWAREDILLEAQASRAKIEGAFAEALSRLISTIGHDGRVTFVRDNLISIDFGTERGLIRGQKIIAGYVVLTSYHPQSGEFLRAKRVPIYELKVLESRKGSSLCQITAMDMILKEQLIKNLNTSELVMLAWRPQEKENADGWREPYDPQTAPILGAADSGFGVPEEKETLPSLPNTMSAPIENRKKVALNTENKENPLPDPGATQKSVTPKTSTEKNSKESKKYGGFHKKAYWNDPKTWTLEEFKIGGGVSMGSAIGSISTAFPSTILNRLNISSMIFFDSSSALILKPYAQYSFYDGNSVSGNNYFLGATMYNDAWSNRALGQHIYLGVGGEINGGNIDTPTKSISLSNVQINPSFRWDSNVPGFGKYNLETAFSLFDIIQSDPVWTLHTEIKPFELIMPQLVFDAGLKRYKNGWIEFMFGVEWDFGKDN